MNNPSPQPNGCPHGVSLRALVNELALANLMAKPAEVDSPDKLACLLSQCVRQECWRCFFTGTDGQTDCPVVRNSLTLALTETSWHSALFDPDLVSQKVLEELWSTKPTQESPCARAEQPNKSVQQPLPA